MNRSIHKQAGIGLAAAALALLLLVNGCSGLSRSPHSGPPSEDIACLTEQHQYPEGTRSITIQSALCVWTDGVGDRSGGLRFGPRPIPGGVRLLGR